MRFESTVSGSHLITCFKQIDTELRSNDLILFLISKLKMDEGERQFILEVTRPSGDDLKARWCGIVGLDGDAITDTRDAHNDNESDGLKPRWAGVVGLDGDM